MTQTPLTTEQQESVIIEYGLSPAAFNALTPTAMHTLYEAIGVDNKVIAAASELLDALKKAAQSMRIASETFGSKKLLSDCMAALAVVAKAEGK